MKCRAWLIKRLLCRLTIFVLIFVNIPTNPTIYNCTKCLFELSGDRCYNFGPKGDFENSHARSTVLGICCTP